MKLKLARAAAAALGFCASAPGSAAAEARASVCTPGYERQEAIYYSYPPIKIVYVYYVDAQCRRRLVERIRIPWGDYDR